MEQRRLVRSRTDRMIAGVCGGLAEYLQIDPSIIRLVFVMLALLSGGTFFFVSIYIVLWLIMPEEGTVRGPTTPAPPQEAVAPTEEASAPPEAEEEAAEEAPAPSEAEEEEAAAEGQDTEEAQPV